MVGQKQYPKRSLSVRQQNCRGKYCSSPVLKGQSARLCLQPAKITVAFY